MKVKCEFFELSTAHCLEPETKKFLKTSACYACNSGKGADGKKLKHPICVLICGCEEETCNIGEVVDGK
jgi:hypothetical protein